MIPNLIPNKEFLIFEIRFCMKLQSCGNRIRIKNQKIIFMLLILPKKSVGDFDNVLLSTGSTTVSQMIKQTKT